MLTNPPQSVPAGVPDASGRLVVVNLNHLHLRVRDVARSIDFYRQYFGLEVHMYHGDVAFMTDAVRFDLALAPDPDDATDVGQMPPWWHFGFRLDSADEVRRAYQRMALAVTVIEPLTEEDGMVSFRCADPDGYSIEVYWE